MGWIEDTVADFGRRIGLPGLDFGTHGVAQLAFDSGALLAVEPVERGGRGEVLVYLARPLGHEAPRLVRAALKRAHFDQAGAMDVQIGTRGQGPDTLLVALTRVPEREFTPQALERALDHLNRWLDSLTR